MKPCNEDVYGVSGLQSRSCELRCSVPEPEDAVATATALMIHADAMDELLRQIVMDFGPPEEGWDEPDCECSACRATRYLKAGGINVW